MRIALGVTGCIAAYKAAEIVRALMKRDAEVDVIMTKHATSFVSPLTFQTLSRKSVIVDQYEIHPNASVRHISLARSIDLLLVAPASADIINKFASGVADDFLTTTFLSCTSPVMIAPTMNPSMYLSVPVQESIGKLKKQGVTVLDPEKGETACGEEGIGRLADVEYIVEKALIAAERSKALKGKHLLVTAGGTREPIDAVRYITNRSSGKMGYAIAEAARKRGAEVTLISGPASLCAPWGVRLIEVETTDEMAQAVFDNAANAHYIFMAAAVADFKPEKMQKKKIKKSDGTLVLKLSETTDILRELRKKKKKAVVVGFAAETGNLIRNAKAKLQEKKLDYIVANDVSKKKIGFGSDRNAATVIDRKGRTRRFPEMYKRELAEKLLDLICSR